MLVNATSRTRTKQNFEMGWPHTPVSRNKQKCAEGKPQLSASRAYGYIS